MYAYGLHKKKPTIMSSPPVELCIPRKCHLTQFSRGFPHNYMHIIKESDRDKNRPILWIYIRSKRKSISYIDRDIQSDLGLMKWYCKNKHSEFHRHIESTDLPFVCMYNLYLFTYNVHTGGIPVCCTMYTLLTCKFIPGAPFLVHVSKVSVKGECTGRLISWL